ncbi:hypothetical protein V493_04169 [Pseudogymnoascus sp. VKM F-4281 (FW-2241)]|nr:hypothetical protein V493_04169 [Pseudogymnoascus sp. VKM F-4281 (FW-2241)]
MTSLFFSTKSTQKAKYSIPNPLDYETVLGILHNQTLLQQVFWPASLNTPIQEENRAGPDLTNISIGLPDPKVNWSLSTHANGVTCIEEMPLGFVATVTYTVYRADADATTSEAEPNLLKPGTLSDSKLYLEEERTIRALKPILGWINFNDGPIIKTQNLARLLEEISRNGNDIGSALASLCSAGKADKFKEE